MDSLSRIFVDACCWINLLATGRLPEIVGASTFRWATSDLVADDEVAPLNFARLDRRMTPLRALATAGIIDVLPIGAALEVELFVRFAAHLDDGEASVCALAVARGGAVATDDRKALRTLERLAPATPVVQTPELLRAWIRQTGLSSTSAREILQAIERDARFRPRTDAPFAAWWNASR